MAILVPTNHLLFNGEMITLRSANKNDAKSFFHTVITYLNENEGQVWAPHEYQKTEADFREWIQEMVEHPKQILILAESKGIIVGNIDFHIGDRMRISHTGEFGMGILPVWRSKGIGSLLLSSLLSWAQNQSEIEKINLRVLANNQRAIGLYKKFGFTEEGRSHKAFKFSESEYVDDIRLAKFLRS